MSFANKFGDKQVKKLMDTSTKARVNVAKTASKRVVQKTAEATGDLVGNKIADKIRLAGKTKNKKKRRQNKLKTRNLNATRKKAANFR